MASRSSKHFLVCYAFPRGGVVSQRLRAFPFEASSQSGSEQALAVRILASRQPVAESVFLVGGRSDFFRQSATGMRDRRLRPRGGVYNGRRVAEGSSQ
jgi:hypothetical protein